jgi:hypothetical protein
LESDNNNEIQLIIYGKIIFKIRKLGVEKKRKEKENNNNKRGK